MLSHPIPPLYDKNSKILILGSFPSVKSRETKFFYGHAQNRFWRVLAEVLNKPLPETVTQKSAMLLENHIALWDVIAQCEIERSADSTIRNVVPNDISLILKNADIVQIFVNGKTAEKYYVKYIKNEIKRDCVCLPSTSPANAAWNIQRLVGKWSVLRDYLGI